MSLGNKPSRLPLWRRGLFMVAVAAGVVVFGRECFDVSRLSPALLVPTWLYFFGSLGLIVMNLREGFRQPELSIRVRSWLRALLVLAVPLNFISSALACSGVIFTGCTPLCTFLARVWTPLVGLVAASYLITGRRWVLPVIMAMCLPYLIPHCNCYNPVNAWWIDRLSLSPVCYAPSYWASIIAIAALLSGRRIVASALASWLIIVVALIFFVGHNYFRFPW